MADKTYADAGVYHTYNKALRREAEGTKEAPKKRGPTAKKTAANAASDMVPAVMRKNVPTFAAHLDREAQVARDMNASADKPDPDDVDASGKPEYDESNLPELDEWDPLTLPENFFLVLEGKRRTGKSTFAKWLLQFYKDRFQIVWVMTKTKCSGYWQKFVGEAFTFDDYNPMAIRKLVARNDKIIKDYGPDSPMTKYLASTLIILDDVISAGIHDDPTFTMMAAEGRHHKLSIILMTQDPKAICPLVRSNADLAICFNQKTFRDKEAMWHDFMNDVSKKTSAALLAKYAVNHDALVCIQTNLNPDMKKNFYKSGSDKTVLEDPEYVLGGPDQKRIVLEERYKNVMLDKMKKEKEKHEMDMIGANRIPPLANGMEIPKFTSSTFQPEYRSVFS